MTAFTALALQVETVAGGDLPAAVDRIGAQVGASKAWLGPDLRLVVLPEYVLTGFPMRVSVAEWRDRAALDPGGAEYRTLGAVAADHDVFLCVNAYERDEHFPDLFFQATVILSPSGEVVLRYRRLHSMFSPTPHDVWERYLEIYGMDGVLPVARTEIGNLAAIASEEILMPELARALALRGAEIFCNPTSEASSPQLTPKAVARRARAVENLAYVVAANSGGLRGIAIPGDSTNGGSEVIDHRGRVLAQAGPGESLVAAAELDLEVLRRARRRPGMDNLPSRVKTALWAEEYARYD
ncbi:nitrilase-related carbon-nitrogen hydrolase [Nonomuraea insulae]|uniref:Nitrilase-related carbon-nitrogen hydrolase n=1 Tax=Nonomuraea insulae TaxID=1616787 RepID=A0ABW1D4U8_9ACTN